MWIFDNLGQLLIAAGLLLAVVDVVFLGFATFFLTLLGLATLTTGILVWVGVVSEQWTAIAIVIALLSTLYSLLLWKPLQRLQKQGGEKKVVTSDLIGHSFVLDCDVSSISPGSYAYSGVTWKLESTDALTTGTRVEVVDVQVGVMRIKAAS